jgi:ribonuclease HI
MMLTKVIHAHLESISMKEVHLYTDGACSGNPGPGGWAAILEWGTHRREISGGYRLTTNNRMEIIAVIEGLKLLNRPCSVRVFTDSRLIVDAFDKNWITNWMENNWRKSDKTQVKNRELWIKLHSMTKDHQVHFEWIRGHNGHAQNELCDKLAVNASKMPSLPADEVYERENMAP